MERKKNESIEKMFCGLQTFISKYEGAWQKSYTIWDHVKKILEYAKQQMEIQSDITNCGNQKWNQEIKWGNKIEEKFQSKFKKIKHILPPFQNVSQFGKKIGTKM
jgi:hypothetical protein